MNKAPQTRFALISDTHIRPSESDDSSPWRVNSYANARARRVVSLLNAYRPEFVVHLGDMVHPLPSLRSYGDAVDEAKRIFAPLEAPMYLVPGNHDIGDKPMPGLPAAPTSVSDVRAFRHQFGPDWQTFTVNNCRFILLNAEVVNSGLDYEKEQHDWLTEILMEPFNGRTFVFIHYPPFILRVDEPSNYDNLDEPGRSELLDLFRQAGVATVFSGHVHNFFYNRLEDMQLFITPALSFVRQDYSELFRGAPGEEFGRDDADKLGFFMVDVYEDHIRPRLIRTYGREESDSSVRVSVPPLSNMPRQAAPLGVHLRHDWQEVVALPYAGPMDEFLRKEARNDYHLLALLELGTRDLRIPLRDLTQDSFRRRAQDLRELGFVFTAFHFGVPDRTAIDLAAGSSELIETLEIVIPWQDRERLFSAAQSWVLPDGMRVSLTRVESSADKKVSGTAFSHYVSYGFNKDSWPAVAETTEAAAQVGVSNYAFTLGWDCALFEVVPELARKGRKKGVEIVANVRLASENPAAIVEDDLLIANRVAQAMLLAYVEPSVRLFLDTFVDHDRGYFPRHGLYDRRLNPRPAAHVYRHLNEILSAGEVELLKLDDGQQVQIAEFKVAGRACKLMLPKSPLTLADSQVSADSAIDLMSGLLVDREEWSTRTMNGPHVLSERV